MAPEAEATHTLFERYGEQIFGYCLHQLGTREEAEDAVQSTFLNAFRGLRRGVVPEIESAWLFKIAQNVCLSRRRSSWRRGRIESPADFEVVQEVAPAPTARADELIGLQGALEQMPDNQRRAILLREWQGLSYREIAGELGLSQAAVETLIFRARRSLAQGLEAPPVEPRPLRARLRSGLDLSAVFGLLKSLLAGGTAVKVAGTAAVVATSVAAFGPVRHELGHRGAPQRKTPAVRPASRAASRPQTVVVAGKLGSVASKRHAVAPSRRIRQHARTAAVQRSSLAVKVRATSAAPPAPHGNAPSRPASPPPPSRAPAPPHDAVAPPTQPAPAPTPVPPATPAPAPEPTEPHHDPPPSPPASHGAADPGTQPADGGHLLGHDRDAQVVGQPTDPAPSATPHPAPPASTQAGDEAAPPPTEAHPSSTEQPASASPPTQAGPETTPAPDPAPTQNATTTPVTTTGKTSPSPASTRVATTSQPRSQPTSTATTPSTAQTAATPAPTSTVSTSQVTHVVRSKPPSGALGPR